MAKLKALNQAAQDIPAVSVVANTSPFVSPILTPIQMEVNVNVNGDGEAAPSQKGNEGGDLGDVAAVVDAVSDNLISYLMGDQVDNSVALVAVETNKVTVEVPESEMVQPAEAVVIDKAGIHQPLKTIGEMLKELRPKIKSRKRNRHIKESNIVVATPVFDKCASEFRMKEKQTPKIKRKGIGHGGGGGPQ